MKMLKELAQAPKVPAESVSTGNEAHEITQLFAATIEDLQNAHNNLDTLMKVLQDRHTHIESAPVAKCIQTTAKSVDEMHKLAAQWREAAEAKRAEIRKTEPGSLNTGINNLSLPTEGHRRMTLHEALVVLLTPTFERYNEIEYIKSQLFFENARTPEQLRKETVFEFDKLLGALGVDE